MLYSTVTMDKAFATKLTNARKGITKARNTMGLCIMLALGSDPETVKKWLCEVFGAKNFTIKEVPHHCVTVVQRGLKIADSFPNAGEWLLSYISGTERSDSFWRFCDKLTMIIGKGGLSIPATEKNFHDLLSEKWTDVNRLYDNKVQTLDGGQWEAAIIDGETAKKRTATKYLPTRKQKDAKPVSAPHTDKAVSMTDHLKTQFTRLLVIVDGISDNPTAQNWLSSQMKGFTTTVEASLLEITADDTESMESGKMDRAMKAAEAAEKAAKKQGPKRRAKTLAETV